MYPNLFISKLRKLNSIFLLFNILYIINTNFLQPLYVKKAHLHRGAPSEPGPVRWDAGLHVLEGGVLLKKEAYFYKFVF